MSELSKYIGEFYEGQRVYSLANAARELGISIRSLEDLIISGEVKAGGICGKIYLDGASFGVTSAPTKEKETIKCSETTGYTILRGMGLDFSLGDRPTSRPWSSSYAM